MLTILWPAARGAIDGQRYRLLHRFFFDAQRGLCRLRDWILKQSYLLGYGYGRRIIDTARVSTSEVWPRTCNERRLPETLLPFFLVIFLLAGAHHIFFEAYFNSFVAIPIRQFLTRRNGTVH